MAQLYSAGLRAGVITAISLLLNQGAVAADSKGQFGVRGAGLISCSLYLSEREAKADVYLMTAAWVDGYLTGTNQHMPDTYDITSFETTELLAAILAEHCKNNPDARVFAVLKGLLENLHQDRLPLHSERTDVVLGDRKISLYVEVLKRIQTQLASKGFYKGKSSGVYDQATLAAMKRFQRSIEFDPTGFPDQMTLWRLLRSSS